MAPPSNFLAQNPGFKANHGRFQSSRHAAGRGTVMCQGRCYCPAGARRPDLGWPYSAAASAEDLAGPDRKLLGVSPTHRLNDELKVATSR